MELVISKKETVNIPDEVLAQLIATHVQAAIAGLTIPTQGFPANLIDKTLEIGCSNALTKEFSGFTTKLVVGERMNTLTVCRIGSDGKAYKATTGLPDDLATIISIRPLTDWLEADSVAEFLLPGSILHDVAFHFLKVGKPVYSDNNGWVTQDIPDNNVQILGIATDVNTWYFFPSLTTLTT